MCVLGCWVRGRCSPASCWGRPSPTWIATSPATSSPSLPTPPYASGARQASLPPINLLHVVMLVTTTHPPTTTTTTTTHHHHHHPYGRDVHAQKIITTGALGPLL